MVGKPIPSEFRAKARARVNAIVGVAIGREPKGGDVERIFRFGIESVQNRASDDEWVSAILKHPRFRDYVLARARERAGPKS